MERARPIALSLAVLTAVACGDSGALQPLPGGPGPADPAAATTDTEQGRTGEIEEVDWAEHNESIVPQVPFQDGLNVELDSGRIRGIGTESLRIFKGIPFAAPPVGELRFRAPQPVEPWDGELDAGQFGPACPQAPLPTMSSQENMSEDCLTANVYAHRDDRVRPVMLWIYGGGYVVGGADWRIYDATEFATNGDVVVVSINYRLGPLGFLATEALQASDPLGATGTQGLMDVVEALRWVRRNAAAFGGDPYNVTVFGESAGGMSVCGLLGSPMADGLFHRAISQSGGGCNIFAEMEQSSYIVPSALETGRSILHAVGCDNVADEVACLQELPAQELVDAVSLMDLFTDKFQNRLRIVPAIDGVVLPEMPIARLQRGEAHPGVKAIFGSNADEATLFTALDMVPSRAAFKDLLVEFLGDGPVIETMMDLYPRSDFPIAKNAFVAFIGDAVFNCGALSAAEAMGDNGRVYYFDQAPVPIDLFMGTMHAIDALYLFGTFDSFGMIPTADDQAVSQVMQDAWSSFARVGRPVFPGGWPAYSPGSPSIAHIVAEPELVAEIRNGRCEQLHAMGLIP